MDFPIVEAPLIGGRMLIAIAFVVPFALLMPRRAKFKGAWQFVGASCAIAGLFIEKYVLVAPSFSPDELVVGWIYPVVTAAFAALFAVSYRIASRRSGFAGGR